MRLFLDGFRDETLVVRWMKTVSAVVVAAWRQRFLP